MSKLSTKQGVKRQAAETADTNELVDVDFDFFNFEEIDFKAISLLFRQLFSHDAKDFDFGKVADFLIADNALGSTVKCDGEQSDPYAFCACLDLATHANHEAIAPIREYLLAKTRAASAAAPITSLLESCKPELPQDQHVGLIICERLLNMPPQVTAPFLRLIAEEMQMAEAQGLAFKCNHLLYLSRTFLPAGDEEENTEDGSAALPQQKRRKSAPGQTTTESDYVPYHVEDYLIQEFSTCTVNFDFTNEPEPTNQPRREDAFGVAEQGRLMLIPLAKLPDLVERLDKEGGGQ